MVKKLSCVSCGSFKRFPHTFTNGSGYWHQTFTLPIVKILNKESFDIFSDMAYTGFASISNCLILIDFVTLN